jgi:hypothetical protein
VRNKALSEFTNRVATKHRKNGENDSQLNTPEPLPLKLLQGSKLHYWLAWQKVVLTSTHKNLDLHTPHYYMTCYLHPEIPRKLAPICKQDPQLLLLHDNRRCNPAGLIPPEQTHHNQNIQQAEQRKNSESCKREKISYI